MKSANHRKWPQTSTLVWLVWCANALLCLTSANHHKHSLTSSLRDASLSHYVIDSDSSSDSTNETFRSDDTGSFAPIPLDKHQSPVLNEGIEALNIVEKATTSAPVSNKSNITTIKSSKRKTHRKSASSSSRHSQSSGGNRRSRPSSALQANLSSVEETVPNQELVRPEHSCVIGEVCTRAGKLGYCYKPHAPNHYERDDRNTEDFVEMLLENCPHFFDENENLRHPLCCSPEQEETIARLNANIDLIRRSCPSCLVNVKKLFCNLFCAPNQRDFVRVDRVKGETVMEVTYAMSDHFVRAFFASCQDVRVFGAYLLDYEYGCGKLKRANCTAVEFMRVLGSLSEIPFTFRPLIVEHNTGRVLHHPRRITESDHNSGMVSAVHQAPSERVMPLTKPWPRAVMNDTGYRCDQAPPNMSPCQCDHCPRICPAQMTNSVSLSANATVSHASTSNSGVHAPHYQGTKPSASTAHFVSSALVPCLTSVIISSSYLIVSIYPLCP